MGNLKVYKYNTTLGQYDQVHHLFGDTENDALSSGINLKRGVDTCCVALSANGHVVANVMLLNEETLNAPGTTSAGPYGAPIAQGAVEVWYTEVGTDMSTWSRRGGIIRIGGFINNDNGYLLGHYGTRNYYGKARG